LLTNRNKHAKDAKHHAMVLNSNMEKWLELIHDETFAKLFVKTSS